MNKNGPVKHYKLTKSGRKIPMAEYKKWLAKKKNDEAVAEKLKWIK